VNHPDDDTLADLALGESAPTDVADHVRGCASCSREVAALRSTLRALREPVPALAAPSPTVWDAVLAEIDAESAPDELTTAEATPGAVTTSERPADELTVHRENRRRRGIPLAWVAGAAAAGLVVGVAGARLLDGDAPASAPVTVASTDLGTLDTGQVKGTADVVRQDDRLDLAVRTEPIDAGDGYLEVWLINEDLERMVSIGVLRPDAPEQTFAIAQDLIDQGYVIVDISREGFDTAPQHSGDSVVRGTLAT
jgi:hypothetical protein